MQIKCENCSIVYEVPENHLIIRHPKFLKCTSCGHVFQSPQLQESHKEQQEAIPLVEQSDVVPMSLSEIFQTSEVQTTSEEQAPLFTPAPTSFQEENAFSKPISQTKENTSADLFAPFDRADEFMPITQADKNKKKRLFGILLFITLLVFALIYFLYAGRYYFVRQAGIPPVLYQKSGIETNIIGEGLAFQNSLFDIVNNQGNYQLIVKSKIINTTDSLKILPSVVIYLKDENGNIVQRKKPTQGKNSLEAGEILPFETILYPIVQTARSIEITFEKEHK